MATGASIDGKVSSIDRSDARFWCQLIHQPARRSSRLPDRSYWPQLCHQPGPQRQASPCGSCLSGCRRGRPRSLSEASARRLAAGATPRPAVRVGARAVGVASPRVAHATRPWWSLWWRRPCAARGDGGSSRSLRASGRHRWPVTRQVGLAGHCTARDARACVTIGVEGGRRLVSIECALVCLPEC